MFKVHATIGAQLIWVASIYGGLEDLAETSISLIIFSVSVERLSGQVLLVTWKDTFA